MANSGSQGCYNQAMTDSRQWEGWALIAAGLALRLAIAPFGGHPGDLPALTRWAAALGEHGWLHIYLSSDANYPPLGMLLIAASRWAYGLLAPGGDLSYVGLWPVMLKLPAMLADVGLALLIWRLAGARRYALWLLASLVFNPALILLSAWWGQLESVYALLALGAVVAAMRGRPLRAGALLGAGLMVKLQAGAVAPVVILAALVPGDDASTGNLPPLFHRLGRLALGVILPIALVMGPFVVAGQGGLMLRRLVALVAGPGWLTVNALNAWYLVTGEAGNWAYQAPLLQPDTAPVLAGLSARTVGSAMLALWSLCVLWAAWKARRAVSDAGWLLAGALLYLGIFLWPTQSHERYAFGAVALLAGMTAAALRSHHPPPGRDKTQTGTGVLWQSAALYAMITLSHTLNLLWAAPPLPWLTGWFAGNVGAGLAIASASLAAALWGWWVLYGVGTGATE